MRPIFIVFSLLTVILPLFCQERNREYAIHNEYATDSIGKSVLKEEVEYRRISNSSSWGFIDSIGNIVIPLGKYKFLNPIDDEGMILAHKDGKEGYIDINENILIPFIYDDIGVFSNSVGLAPAVKNYKQGFINREGETVIPFEYDHSSYVRYFYEPGIAVLLKNGKYGVINHENKIIIPFSYDKIDFSRNSDIIIAWKQEKWVCFSTTGKQLSDFSNYEIVSKSPLGYLPEDSKNLPILVRTKEDEEYFSILKNTTRYLDTTAQNGIRYAYLDKNHNMLVPFGVYDYADVFGLGRKAIVADKGKYGIINEHGQLVLPLEYEFVEQPYRYSNYAKIFVATKQGTVTIFDENMNTIPITGIVSYFNNDGRLFVTDKENKKGVISYTGEQIIPCLYDTLLYSGTEVPGCIAKKDGLYGFISQNNKIIQPFKYKYIYPVKGNMAYVDQNNKVGIYNKDGSVMIPFEYDAIDDTYYNYRETLFSNTENIYIVEKDGEIGTIDDKNNVIIPIIYDGLSGWVEYGPEAHFVKKGDKYGIISPKGKIIIPIKYDYVGLPQNEIIVVRKEGKYGVISYKNKEILPCEYNNVIVDIPVFWRGEKTLKSKIVVLQQNNWKYYDLKGKLLQSNVPLKEINDNYDYIFNWGEPSNEHYDFDIKQKGGLEKVINNRFEISLPTENSFDN